MKTITLPVRGFAIATLHGYAEEGIIPDADRDDPEMAEVVAVVDAYRAGGPYPTGDTPRRLVFTADRAEDVARGLTDLANGEDDQADVLRKRDPEGARYSRAARDGLSSLASRARRHVPGLVWQAGRRVSA